MDTMFVYSDSEIQGSCLTANGILAAMVRRGIPKKKLNAASEALLEMKPGDYFKIAGIVVVCTDNKARWMAF